MGRNALDAFVGHVALPEVEAEGDGRRWQARQLAGRNQPQAESGQLARLPGVGALTEVEVLAIVAAPLHPADLSAGLLPGGDDVGRDRAGVEPNSAASMARAIRATRMDEVLYE